MSSLISRAKLLPHDLSTSEVPISSVSLETALDVTHAGQSPSPLISFEIRIIAQWVFNAILLFLISTFGIITNILNIICFVKQGLKDPVNTSLLGLAMSDLGCLVASLMNSICFYPTLQNSDIPVDTVHLAYMVAGWPYILFIRLTSWITALITLERCLCMTMPLKVKTIITPKRVGAIIFCVFIILLACVAPEYYTNRLVMKFVPERNRTILSLGYTLDRESIQKVTFTINFVLMPFSSYFMIVICTTVLVFSLRKKAKWRKTSTVQANDIFKRDKKVTKMVVVISALFIVCFLPLCVTYAAMLVVPELNVGGLYERMLYVLVGISFVLESTNSSANIFIYYHMSTRYRTMFQRLFTRAKVQ